MSLPMPPTAQPAFRTFACAAALALALIGCDRGEDPTDVTLAAQDLPPSAGLVCGGESPGDGSFADGGVPGECLWQSSDWSGDPWLSYPARATVTLPHTLGRLPAVVTVYISFEPSGEGSALAAGDLARIVEVTNATLTITNDTNTDYYFRVVLE